MKPLTQLGCALAIAITCGGGGYWLGTRQAPAAVTPRETSAAPAVEKTSRRDELPAFDSSDLRLKLDAEKNALTRFNLAMTHLEKWMDTNPTEALEWLDQQPVSRRRGEVIRMALRQYAETDAKGAAEWALQHLSGGDLNNNLIVIANQWAKQNGQEAASWFLKLPPTRERDAAVEGMFFTWASNEPSSALEYIQSSSEIGDQSSTLRRASLAGWAKTDPEAAVAASLEISRTQDDPGQFANTLANWATMDLESSSQWLLDHVQAGPQRTAAVAEIAAIFAHQEPATGIAWLEKLTDPVERAYAASNLAVEWSRESPAEAANWVSRQPPNSMSAEVIEEISHNFLRKDPAAFETWRASLPAGAIKEQADQIAASDEDS